MDAVVTPSAQATGTAVSGLYTTIGATVTVLADRVQATGAALTMAAARYDSTDEDSGQRLVAVAASVQT